MAKPISAIREGRNARTRGLQPRMPQSAVAATAFRGLRANEFNVFRAKPAKIGIRPGSNPELSRTCALFVIGEPAADARESIVDRDRISELDGEDSRRRAAGSPGPWSSATRARADAYDRRVRRAASREDWRMRSAGH